MELYKEQEFTYLASLTACIAAELERNDKIVGWYVGYAGFQHTDEDDFDMEVNIYVSFSHSEGEIFIYSNKKRLGTDNSVVFQHGNKEPLRFSFGATTVENINKKLEPLFLELSNI